MTHFPPRFLFAIFPVALALSACSGETDDDTGRPPGPTNYVLVAADELKEAAKDIVVYRHSTGYRVDRYTVSELVSSPDDSAALLDAVHDLLTEARAGLDSDEPLYLLLLGDALVPDELPAVPCIKIDECAEIYVEDGMISCCSDNPYGDLDGDLIPEVAVGRLPAHNAEDVAAYLRKLEEHETQYEPGLWNRRISMFTGEGGFGAQIDELIEALVMNGLSEVDHSFDVIGTYDNTASDFYYTPMLDKIIEFFNSGALMVVYVGHGSKTQTQSFGIQNLAAINCQHRRPFVFLFTCLNGLFTGEFDSLAEALVRLESGPVVSFASAELSHPYGNAVLGYEAQRALMDNRFATVGEAILFIKQESISNDSDFRQTIDIGALISGEDEDRLLELRDQHLTLYNLFGDPAAAIPYPRSAIDFDSELGGSIASGSLTVSGTAPGITDGSALVTLEVERNVIVGDMMPVDPASPNTGIVQANWAKAVDKTLASATVDVTEGAFEATLTFDPEVPDCALYVKVYADDGVNDSFGFVLVE